MYSGPTLLRALPPWPVEGWYGLREEMEGLGRDSALTQPLRFCTKRSYISTATEPCNTDEWQPIPALNCMCDAYHFVFISLSHCRTSVFWKWSGRKIVFNKMSSPTWGTKKKKTNTNSEVTRWHFGNSFNLPVSSEKVSQTACFSAKKQKFVLENPTRHARDNDISWNGETPYIALHTIKWASHFIAPLLVSQCFFFTPFLSYTHLPPQAKAEY